MTVITLTTDFGTKDGFVGTMKGVIWGICPSAHIADISHEIAPQNVLEGAFVLWRAERFFPAGTVHIAVVDPGVGTSRRAMAARLGGMYYVGPDNGLPTILINDVYAAGEDPEYVVLDNPRFHLNTVSRTFHGRDIFAPVGAHLAAGVPFEELGTPFKKPVLLRLPRPDMIHNGYRVHVLLIDAFGNLTIDLPVSAVAARQIVIRIKGREIRGLSSSYGHHQPGELIALGDSDGGLEIAVVNGSAARQLDVRVGDTLEVLFADSKTALDLSKLPSD